MYYLGIDVGSLSCDAALIDEQGQLQSWTVVPTGARNRDAITRARREVLERAGIDDAAIVATVSTGYGRDRVEGHLAAVTEITCHARGIRELLPGTDLLIDIGGQDSKVILLGSEGRVANFAMNDKCAAGTGRFLEAMARALEVEVDELGALAARATGELTLSSVCTVFAESEVVSLIAEGTASAEIAAGLHRSVAQRTRALLHRVTPQLDGHTLAISGGVARNAGVVRALQRKLGREISVPPEPDTVGALGAALVALERHQR